MIECVDKKIWYVKRRKVKNKKKKKKSCRKKLLLFCFIFLFTLLFVYLNLIVAEKISEECEQIVKEYSIIAVNNAVLTTLYNNEYDELMSIAKNSDGSISYISINSSKSNLINRNVASVSKKNLTDILKNGIPIPLGAFTGIPIFGGLGKEIDMKVVSVENVVCDFVSEFSEKGINQTLHRLYLTVEVSVDIMIPHFRRSAITKSEVLLGESLIIGKIPEVYLQGTNIA